MTESNECVFSKQIYTGKAVVSNAYLVFNGQKINGLSKGRKGRQLFSEA